jgi:DNA-binding CsgD family transcriptional regulator
MVLEPQMKTRRPKRAGTTPTGSLPRQRFRRDYQISMAAGHEGELLALCVDCEDVTLKKERRRCYELLEGLARPCPGCPVFATQASQGTRTGLLPHRGAPDEFFVVTAVNRRRVADVSLQSVPAAAVPLLILGKLNQLASAARLTEQEKRVLHLLVLGRGIADIATALEIAARTVKFHQRNALDKLGADGRNDVLRLLLSER